MHRVTQKLANFCTLLTSSNIDQFLNFFHSQNQGNFCINTINKDHITPQMCRYTTLWNVKVLKQQLKTRLL